MNGRLKARIVLAVIGLAFVAGSGYALYKTNQGAQALQAFSAAQNVTLSYDDQVALGGENAGGDGDHVAPRQRLGLRGRQDRAEPD